MRFFYLLPFLSFIIPQALYAEGEEDVMYEEVIEEEAAEEEPADENFETATSPASANGNDITALRAQIASLTNKVQQLEGQLKVQRQTPSTAPGAIPIQGPANAQAHITQDPDVKALMQEIGATNEQELEKSLDAHSAKEAAAMAHAHQKTGHLPVGPAQSDFDRLHKLYNEVMLADAATLPQKAQAFTTTCNHYITTHQTDPSSRSALYYLGRVLLKQNKLKESQSTFARVYRGDEQGPHAADALIGMAEILIAQGNHPAAIKFLEKIKKDFKADYLTKETKESFKSVALRANSKLSFDTPLKSVASKQEVAPSKQPITPSKGKSA